MGKIGNIARVVSGPPQTPIYFQNKLKAKSKHGANMWGALLAVACYLESGHISQGLRQIKCISALRDV